MKKVENGSVAPKKEVAGRDSNGGNVVAAIFFITVGFIFLANNLGIIPWTVWSDSWKFWPVTLVLIGIQFLLGKSKISQIILALITVTVFLCVIFYILTTNGILTGTEFENLLLR